MNWKFQVQYERSTVVYLSRLRHPFRNHQTLLGSMLMALTLLVATTAQAAGPWYDPYTYSSCGSGSTGGTYIGNCKAPGQGDALNAVVTFDDSTSSTTPDADAVYGGFSVDGSARNNQVSVSGSIKIKTNVYGGRSGGNVTGNSATISDRAEIGSSAYGGYSYAGDVNGNTVTVRDNATTGFSIFGGHSTTGNANGNTAVVSGNAAINGNVWGGYSWGASGNANGNTIRISGGTFYAAVGGTSYHGDTNNNTIEISNGTINGYVLGGWALDGGNANGNTIRISGGTIKGPFVAGGIANSGNAINNRVILSGNPVLTGVLLGGGSASGISTGNTLETHGTGFEAKNVAGFQQYDFYLPSDVHNGATVLALADTAETDISGAQVSVFTEGSNAAVLQAGDRVNLIHNANGVTADSKNNQTARGPFLQFDYDLLTDADNLYLKVTGIAGKTPQAKAPAESRVSPLTLVSLGSDLAANQGMMNAIAAARFDKGFAIFITSRGGHARHDTGSHVDVDSFNLMAGVSKRFANTRGSLTLGAFLEGGWASADTYNDFGANHVVNGNGNSNYFGGGLMLHKDWADEDLTGPYFEALLRTGSVDYDWSSNDLLGIDYAHYDASSSYYAAYVGGGYVLPLTQRTSLDMYAQYYYAHLDGENATIADAPFEFDAVDSHRTRLGVRLNHDLGNTFTAYAGTAWEHEFDGQLRAAVYGVDTGTPSLEGDTAILEVGLKMQPDSTSPLTATIGIEGFTGAREGIAGKAGMVWWF